MTRLDENRAKAQLAKKAGVPVRDVTNVAIWGNHSATQFPDFAHAKIGGKPAPDVIGDPRLARSGEFIETVQKRGAAVIEARGSSSAASAAHAAIDSVNSVWRRRPATTGTRSRSQPRRVRRARGPAVRLPGRAATARRGRSSRASSTTTSPRSKIKITTDELVAERDEVRSLGLIPS